MNISISRLVMGLIFLIAGIFFIILAIFAKWFMIFYGLVFLALGIVLLLNKNEDKIEERQDLNKKKNKK